MVDPREEKEPVGGGVLLLLLALAAVVVIAAAAWDRDGMQRVAVGAAAYIVYVGPNDMSRNSRAFYSQGANEQQ